MDIVQKALAMLNDGRSIKEHESLTQDAALPSDQFMFWKVVNNKIYFSAAFPNWPTDSLEELREIPVFNRLSTAAAPFGMKVFLQRGIGYKISLTAIQEPLFYLAQNYVVFNPAMLTIGSLNGRPENADKLLEALIEAASQTD